MGPSGGVYCTGWESVRARTLHVEAWRLPGGPPAMQVVSLHSRSTPTACMQVRMRTLLPASSGALPRLSCSGDATAGRARLVGGAWRCMHAFAHCTAYQRLHINDDRSWA